MINLGDKVKLDISKAHPSKRKTFAKYKDTVGTVISIDDGSMIIGVKWPDGCYLTVHWHRFLLLPVNALHKQLTKGGEF